MYYIYLCTSTRFFLSFYTSLNINCRIHFGTFAVILNCSTRRVLLGLWVEPPAHPLPRTRHSACVMRHMWFFFCIYFIYYFFCFCLRGFRTWFGFWLVIVNLKLFYGANFWRRWDDFCIHMHMYTHTYVCLYGRIF